MRNVWAGLTLAAGLFCGVTFAQNAQPNNQGTQPGAAGQKQGEPAGQGQTRPGQAGQQPQPGGVIQPGPAGQTGQQRQQGQFTQGGQQAAGGDQQIAACVYGECHNEIEIAKFVESKLQTEEAREFAQRMVREHSPGCQEMQRLAGNLAAGGQAVGQRQDNSGNLDWVSIKKQIGEQCLASIKQELGAKQGIDLDKCFMG